MKILKLMTDRRPSTDEDSGTERQPRPLVAADSNARTPFTVADLLAYHDDHPQTRKFYFSRQKLTILSLNNSKKLFSSLE